MYLIKKKNKEEYISRQSPDGRTLSGSYYWNQKEKAIKFSLEEMKKEWKFMWGSGCAYPEVPHTDIEIIKLDELKTFVPQKRAINLK